MGKLAGMEPPTVQSSGMWPFRREATQADYALTPPAADTEAPEPRHSTTPPDLLEAAWGVIANAGGWPSNGGDSPGWLDAAQRWRDDYHAWLDRQVHARPQPVFVEVVERLPGTDLARAEEVGYLVPNEIRLNGVPLAAPRDEPVVLHSVTVGDGELVQVTLTLYARRVVVGHEAKEDQA